MLKISDRYWYYRLVKSDENKYSLMSFYSLGRLNKMITACFTPNHDLIEKKEEDKSIRLYSAFRTYTCLAEYILSFSEEDRTFYEIIFGEFDQKLHFDIDIVENLIEYSEEIKDDLIFAVYQTFKDLFQVKLILEKDILIFTSHGENKKSFHIIIDNYRVKNNTECKKLYEICISKIDNEDFRKTIDQSVYGKRQNFRIVGCTKKKNYRPKIFLRDFSIYGKEYRNISIPFSNNEKLNYYNILLRSLVSLTYDCKLLKGFYEVKETVYDEYDIPENIILEVMKLVKEKIKDSPFVIISVVNSVISLKATKKYYCQLCHRTHESENPFIIVGKNSAYWYCRRNNESSERSKIHIMDLDLNQSFEIDEDDESIGPILQTKILEIEKIDLFYNQSSLKDEKSELEVKNNFCVKNYKSKNFKEYDTNIDLNFLKKKIRVSTKVISNLDRKNNNSVLKNILNSSQRQE